MAACKACLTAHSLEENMFRVLLTHTEMATHSVMSNRTPLAPKLQVSVALLKCLQAGLHNLLVEFPQMGRPLASVVTAILSDIICLLGEIFENCKCSSSALKGVYFTQVI